MKETALLIWLAVKTWFKSKRSKQIRDKFADDIKQEEQRMKNELMKNVLKQVLVIMLVGTMTSCMALKRAYVWTHDTINDIETTVASNTVPPVVSQPTGQPDKPAEALPVNGDAIDFKTVKWTKTDGSKAIVTRKFHSATINGSKVSIKYNKLDWWDKDGCNALLCFFVVRNGVVQGGKMDHLRSGGQSVKLMENIHGGYIPNIIPIVNGETAYWCIVSYDGKQRTNLIKSDWK